MYNKLIDHNHQNQSNFNLAVSATTHCLIGCGIGEVFGVTVGTMLGLGFFQSIVLGIMAGFIFGYSLGIIPLLQAHMILRSATKIVFFTETASIVVMETGEVLTEIYFPGMMQAGINDAVFWLGLATSLVVGFLAAFPVNFYLVKRGVRHEHHH